MARETEGLGAEYEGADFGDARLDRRLINLAALMAVESDSSFPTAAGGEANLEATYRFLNNDRVTPERILAPHVRRTIERCGSATRVIVAHDTTELNFGASPREDLGRVGRGKSYGFYAHTALAVCGDASRETFGVLGLHTHFRRGGKGRRGHQELQSAPDNESRRWLASVEAVEELLRPGIEPIHVMDREADCYSLLADLIRRKSHFVIRMASAKRRTTGEEFTTVGDALAGATVLAEREVPITSRKRSSLPSYRKHFPERDARVARLQATAARVTLVRPDSSSQCPEPTLALHAVRIFEPNPPDGEPAIEWRLWTTTPIDTAEQLLAIVDAYRCRWRIEEYHKALKTGCALETRQLESSAGLLNTLALFIPIAWRLLQLRSLARASADAPAEQVLSPSQIACLRFALRRLKRPELPPTPTIRDAMLGVAGLGGHIKNNGDPGWIVLGRGLDKLLTIELGYLAAKGEM
jgi:hypothetical protein